MATPRLVGVGGPVASIVIGVGCAPAQILRGLGDAVTDLVSGLRRAVLQILRLGLNGIGRRSLVADGVGLRPAGVERRGVGARARDVA